MRHITTATLRGLPDLPCGFADRANIGDDSSVNGQRPRPEMHSALLISVLNACMLCAGGDLLLENARYDQEEASWNRRFAELLAASAPTDVRSINVKVRAAIEDAVPLSNSTGVEDFEVYFAEVVANVQARRLKARRHSGRRVEVIGV